MPLTFPEACDSPLKQAHYVYRLKRRILLKHNEMGARVRAGTLSREDFRGWKALRWKPLRVASGIAAARLRFIVHPHEGREIESDFDSAVHARRQELRTIGSERKDWDDADEAKAVITELNRGAAPAEFTDPVENFSTDYTDTDPSGDTAITATKVDVTSCVNNSGMRVWKDAGAAHFGNYEHLYRFYYTGGSAQGARAIGPGVSNQLDEIGSWTTGECTMCARGAADVYTFYYVDRGTPQTDSYVTSFATDHYVTISRSGTTGTCDVYSDAGRITQVGDLDLTVTNTTYRYVYGANTGIFGGDTAQDSTFYVENLDLQEAAAAGNPWHYYKQLSGAAS